MLLIFSVEGGRGSLPEFSPLLLFANLISGYPAAWNYFPAAAGADFFLILMASSPSIRYANVNGVYALGSWEAAPTFKSSDRSQFLVGGGALASLSFLGEALDPNKVKNP